jgi:hypothetical protein
MLPGRLQHGKVRNAANNSSMSREAEEALTLAHALSAKGLLRSWER